MEKTQLLKQAVAKAMDYSAYRQLIDELLEAGKTTGPKQSEELTGYTKLNVQRMNRLDKTVKILPEITMALEALNQPLTWLIITEGWCGDAAQIVPVLQKLTDATPNIDLKLVLRDENPDLMDLYLTNGSKSIPKLIVLDEDYREIAVWGPRPQSIQEVITDAKSRGIDMKEVIEKAHLAYARDKTRSTQLEMLQLLDQLHLVLV
ncbi:thioredoxin family protein [Pontibacter sp. G13]|uniref:thioredoxin family protein n=1 Tax=Pontibacter sp. G13 TaxID=3074898 RepID=UPI00288922C5|nr:thioredoxin family protein [Pontibacter sp. G13]WNJ16551.1 thioredoxin family protein [Pontibacter sp. G13]